MNINTKTVEIEDKKELELNFNAPDGFFTRQNKSMKDISRVIEIFKNFRAENSKIRIYQVSNIQLPKN